MKEHYSQRNKGLKRIKLPKINSSQIKTKSEIQIISLVSKINDNIIEFIYIT
jgi:hypothetical protein